jgi:hypothetical protein
MSISPDINDRENNKFRERLGKPVVATEDSSSFHLNEVAESAPITYIGSENADGDWLINKVDETSGIVSGWASEVNNPTVTTYTAAWTDRATLTYGNYSAAF